MLDPGKCRSCGAKIVWATTTDGKKLPLNHTRVRFYRLDDDGTAHVAKELGYISHFVSCPQASQHSRGKEQLDG